MVNAVFILTLFVRCECVCDLQDSEVFQSREVCLGDDGQVVSIQITVKKKEKKKTDIHQDGQNNIFIILKLKGTVCVDSRVSGYK